MIVLRPYQLDAVEALRRSFASGSRAPLLSLPTGGGKTIIFSEIVRSAESKGNRVLILVHRSELLRQTVDKLRMAGVEPGVIMADERPDYDRNTQVASIQTLVRRVETHPIREPKLIVVDEAHMACAASWRYILQDVWPKALRLGCTATAGRTDGHGLREIFDDLVMGPSVRELQDIGFLSRTRYFAPPQIDCQGLRVVAGEYEREELAERARAITGDAVSTYQRLSPGKQAIAFCVSVQNSKELRDAFIAAGIPAVHVDGDTDQDERHATIEAFRERKAAVLCNVDIGSTGLDIPGIEVAILLRPTLSLVLHLQQLGRCLRPAPEKVEARVHDHSGNCLVHGFAEDARVWSLDGVQKKPKNALPAASRCASCYAMWPSTGRLCPQCGAERELTPREVELRQGELREIEARRADEQAHAKERERRGAKTLADLIALGKARGYHPGWAYKVHGGRRSA